MNAPQFEAGPLTVVKIGGGLLGDPPALARACGAVARRRLRGERVLVVISALRGVTDSLERAVLLALDPRAGHELVRDVMERLQAQHARMASELPDPESVLMRLQPVFDGLERLLTGIRLTGEATPRSRDLAMAQGERLAAPLVAAAILAAGADARAVTSEEAGLVATGNFRVGSCDLAASAPSVGGLTHELHDRALVLTGFYGVNRDGDVVLFGRGGSDYTAGVAAALLGADRLELWKDVPGFMTADPREVSGAHLVPELSFDEACELGLYGARIMHPRCLDPLRGRPIAVSVRSIDEVDSIGTALIEKRQGRRPEVVALAARRDVAVVRVQDASMINEPGVAGRILTAMGAAGINVDAVGSSMSSLSFTIGREQSALARRTLRLLAEGGATGLASITILEQAALLAWSATGWPATRASAGGCSRAWASSASTWRWSATGRATSGSRAWWPERAAARARPRSTRPSSAARRARAAGGRARERRSTDRRDEGAERRRGTERRVGERRGREKGGRCRRQRPRQPRPGRRRRSSREPHPGCRARRDRRGRTPGAARARQPSLVRGRGRRGLGQARGARLGDVLDERRATTVDVAGLLGAPSSGHGGAGAAAAADSLGTPTLPGRARRPAPAGRRAPRPARLRRDLLDAALGAGPRDRGALRAARARLLDGLGWRMDEHTPLLLAGVNAEQIARLAEQQRAQGWRGFVAPGPNCTVVGLAVSLAPLLRSHGVRSVTLTSMQAVSGAGGKAPGRRGGGRRQRPALDRPGGGEGRARGAQDPRCELPDQRDLHARAGRGRPHALR
jgi:aspartate kinase